jgi:NADPH:quinone reductase-like Zn-dependent oxidoreductase
MRAAVHERYGPPLVLRIAEVLQPEPGPRDLLVKVHASTMNRSDCGFRAAKPSIVRPFSGLLRPRHPVSGTEFSGVVAAIGREVTEFAEGDAVFGRLQDERPGAHAQYLRIPESGAVAHKPANLSHEQAAAICDGAMMAAMYLRQVDLERRPRILINGASGAIGSAAVQLAKARGALVTAVCKTEAVEIMQGLGADRIVDYRRDDFTATDAVYDVVLDVVPTSSLGRCRRLLREGGHYLSAELGPWCQHPLMALWTPLARSRVQVRFPIPFYRKWEAVALKELAEAGRFTPVIDRAYPLEEIVAAATYVETGEKIGNVVIRIADDA